MNFEVTDELKLQNLPYLPGIVSDWEFQMFILYEKATDGKCQIAGSWLH